MSTPAKEIVVEVLVPSTCFYSSAFDTNAATTLRASHHSYCKLADQNRFVQHLPMKASEV
jgi:hypothetical protein